MPPNGWNEWSRYVLEELKRLNKCYDSLDEKFNQINAEIAKLKIKSGVWGAIAGAIPVVIFLILRSL